MITNTTINQARTKLRQVVEGLKTSWTDYPLSIEYDNLFIINFESQAKPFLRVSMVFQDGQQADLAEKPIHRIPGSIIIEAYDKIGAGNANSDKLLSHFYPAIHMTDANPPLRTYAAKIVGRMPVKGWMALAAVIPFWYDSKAA